MSFWVAEADAFGNIMSGTISQLIPGPTYVVYPDHFYNNVRTSKDGNAIVQVPIKDTRPRRWVWREYRTSVPKYNTLFQQLFNYHYKLRQAQGKSPWVYVRDSESLNLGYINLSGTTWVETSDFVQAKVSQVTRNISPQGGYATYGETIFEFFITDSRFSNF